MWVLNRGKVAETNVVFRLLLALVPEMEHVTTLGKKIQHKAICGIIELR